MLPYASGAPDVAEFAYGNETVYFAQPSLSQFIPGGFGAGAVHQRASIGLKDTQGNTPPLTGRNAPKSNTGTVLRYAPPSRCPVPIVTFVQIPPVGNQGSL